MEELKFNVTAECPNPVITILQGQSEKVIHPLKVELNGTIEAPSEYYLKRKETIIKNNSHLEVNYSKKSIKLIVGENIANNIVVTGQAQLFKDFVDLGINSKTTYTLSELATELKFKGCYFKDRDAHLKLLSNLQNFKIKVEQDFANSNDFKGTAANSKATKIMHEIPLDFKLSMPVILGQSSVDIDVEVCIDATNGSVQLWLECIQLKNDMDKIISDLIDTEIKKFNEELVVVTVG